MKKVIALTLMLAGSLLFNAYAAELIQVNNKICPVSNEAVGSHGMTPHTVTYKGKVYNLCCAMCEKDFNKDPDKYVKIMEDEVAADQAASAKQM